MQMKANKKQTERCIFSALKEEECTLYDFLFQMIAFLIANLISFFGGIGLAIFVGLFYNLWKIPMKAYAEKNCVFEYHQQTSQTFCQCKIMDKTDVQTMDADRLWIYGMCQTLFTEGPRNNLAI